MEKCTERFLYHYNEALRYMKESERAYEKKDDLIPLYGESKYFYYLLSTPLFSMINEFLNALEVFLKCLKVEFYSYLDMIEISEALKVVEEVDKLKKIVKIRNNIARLSRNPPKSPRQKNVWKHSSRGGFSPRSPGCTR